MRALRARRAPEFVARGEVRPACDVYAFGVVLCELLSNKPAVMPKEGEKARRPQLRASPLLSFLSF